MDCLDRIRYHSQGRPAVCYLDCRPVPDSQAFIWSGPSLQVLSDGKPCGALGHAQDEMSTLSAPHQPLRPAVQPPRRTLWETSRRQEVEEYDMSPSIVIVVEGQDSRQWTVSLTPMGGWFYEKVRENVRPAGSARQIVSSKQP